MHYVVPHKWHPTYCSLKAWDSLYHGSQRSRTCLKIQVCWDVKLSCCMISSWCLVGLLIPSYSVTLFLEYLTVPLWESQISYRNFFWYCPSGEGNSHFSKKCEKEMYASGWSPKEDLEHKWPMCRLSLTFRHRASSI